MTSPACRTVRLPRSIDRLFGDRSPIALLPVGMGLAAGDRDELTAGLEDLRVVRDMPPCVSGTTFEWPEVVFDSAGRRRQRCRGGSAGRDMHVHRGPDRAAHHAGTARGPRRRRRIFA